MYNAQVPTLTEKGTGIHSHSSSEGGWGPLERLTVSMGGRAEGF